MTKSSYDNIVKPVRKRSAKTGTLVGVRLQSEQIKAIDRWAARQVPPVTRPEAIRGMIDAMLHTLAKDPREKPAKKAARSARATELAAKAIDGMIDPSAPPEERAQRRRRLTKGPSEFREDRVDMPKAKGK
jgi:hypothetical protein